MYQCQFLSFDKCTAGMEDVKNEGNWPGKGCVKILYTTFTTFL